MAETKHISSEAAPAPLRELIALLDHAGFACEVVEDDDRFYVDAPAACRYLAGKPFGGLISFLFGGMSNPVETVCLPGGVVRYRFAGDAYVSDAVAYWGTPAALIAGGHARALETTFGPGRVRKSQSSYGASNMNKWSSRLAPSGLVYLERSQRRRTPEAIAQTEAREAWLDRLREAARRGDDVALARREVSEMDTEWVGTASDLITSGVCEQAQLPAGRKRICRGDGEGKISLWTASKIGGDVFIFRVLWSEDERERRRAAGIGARATPESCSSDDPDSYAARCEGVFAMVEKMCASLIAGGDGRNGHCTSNVRYDAQTCERVVAALSHARQLLQSATPIVTKAARQVRAARDDPGFAAFLRKSGLES